MTRRNEEQHRFSARGPRASADQRGFSLIELMIAIVCTLFVSGAIVAMLMAGNNAFKREPALSDRQQNVRVAMDLIQRDIATAGVGMDPWVQAFMIRDEAGTALNAKGPVGPDGVAADDLEIVGNLGECPTVPTLAGAATPARPLPACYVMPALVHLQGDPAVGQYAVGFACDGTINFPAGQAGQHNFPGFPATGAIPASVTEVSAAQVVRYAIIVDGEGIPNLWRSPTGGINPTATCGGTPIGTGYQMIARGIEDLQVVYILADALPGTRVDSPPAVVRTSFATVVREVEVTITARSMPGNFQGETDPVGGPTVALPRALRQHLRTTTAARAVLLSMGQQTPPGWN